MSNEQNFDRQYHSHLSGNGHTMLFEKMIADLTDHKYAISSANATLGILGVFQALGIRDAEVIVNPLTWPGSLAGPILLGNKMKNAPLDSSQRLDLSKFKNSMSDQTKAVLTCDIQEDKVERLDAIKNVCEEKGIFLIHDAARSFLSSYKGNHTGYFADVTILSFGATKWFSLYEGCCVLTNNEIIYRRLIEHMTHPDRQLKELGRANDMVLNYRMNPIVAEYGLNKMRELLHV